MLFSPILRGISGRAHVSTVAETLNTIADDSFDSLTYILEHQPRNRGISNLAALTREVREWRSDS